MTRQGHRNLEVHTGGKGEASTFGKSMWTGCLVALLAVVVLCHLSHHRHQTHLAFSNPPTPNQITKRVAEVKLDESTDTEDMLVGRKMNQ